MKLLQLGMASGIMMACSLNLYSQNASAVIDVNNVRAEMQSNGQLFTNGQTGKFFPVEPGLAEKTLLQSAGLWIVGKNASGELVGAVQTSAQTDFTPGILALIPPDDLVQGIWTVNCSDIRQHQEDFEDNGILDNPNNAIMGWPAKGNPFFSAYNPGQTLPVTEQALAGFSDLGPSFGTYEPEEGDAPSIEIRGCFLAPSTADKMASFVFNDRHDNHASGLKPIGLEVQTQAFAYASSEQKANNTIFVRYKMINRNTEPMVDTYVGVLADFSVGNPNDDFAGSDPTQETLFAYNGDAIDEGGFGTDIPAVGMTLMRGPIEFDGNDFYYLPVAHYMVLNDVENLQSESFHRILSGQFPDGSPAPNNGVMFVGNPDDPNSNAETVLGNTPGKRVGVASFGPFTLLPGAVNEVIVAYSYAYLPGNTPAQNVELLLENSAGPKAMFADCFLASNNACSLSSPVIEPSNHDLRIFPNPGSSFITIETGASTFSRIEVSNMLGQLVKQEILNVPSNHTTLQIVDLQNGVYLLRVGTQTKSMVIQH